MSWKCKECEAINRDSTVRCTCGFEFSDETMEAAARLPEKDALSAQDDWLSMIGVFTANLKSDDWMVREKAVDSLIKLNIRATIGSLIFALNDRDTDIKQKTFRALKIKTGQDFGQDSNKWAEWWELNKTIIPTDLPPVSLEEKTIPTPTPKAVEDKKEKSDPIALLSSGVSIAFAVVTYFLFETGHGNIAWVVIVFGGALVGLIIGLRNKRKQQRETNTKNSVQQKNQPDRE
jgi:hypothetical protein